MSDNEMDSVPLVKPRTNWIRSKTNAISQQTNLNSVKPIIPSKLPSKLRPNVGEVKVPEGETEVVIPSAKPKLTDYKCYNAADISSVYVQLLNDNLIHLIEYVYNNVEKDAYKLAATRVSLAMQMILASNQLIPYHIASLIAKDIEDLKKNDEYINQWENPTLKRKSLTKELEFLKKHTEIDETISLNLADKSEEEEQKQNLKDFDIHSGVSTLNVSSRYPIEIAQTHSCLIM